MPGAPAMADLSDLVSEYSSSEHFLFADPAMKPHAEALLAFWCTALGGDHSIPSVERAFRSVGTLDLPRDIRVSAPAVVKEFLSFTLTTGRNPAASVLIDSVSLIEKKYHANFRDDGTFKGETHTRKSTPVGRNDPCPCGSGRKFKQCCMNLIA